MTGITSEKKRKKRSNLKIAIVEDDPRLCELYGQAIENLGHQRPSPFRDGTSIVKALTESRKSFDVIIMDYQLPEMSGIEAAKIIQRYREKTRIVILSGYEHVRSEASRVGFPFLKKPCTLQQLANCIEGSSTPS